MLRSAAQATARRLSALAGARHHPGCSAATTAIATRTQQSNNNNPRQYSTWGVPGGPLVGFIGLGNMGVHMARNLSKQGNTLVLYDTNPDVLQQFPDHIVAKNPAEVAAQAKTIITMLPSGVHVKSCFEGEDGILQTLQPESLIIDASTTEAAEATARQADVAERDCGFVDAPVSGGVTGAENGTLTFMVGASTDNFEAAKPLLEQMGKTLWHCGDVGAGQAVKVCNNMLLAISMIGAAETMNLGARLGVDPKLLSDILSSSTGRCWSIDSYNPCPGVVPGIPSSRDYEGGFGCALMKKDLGLAMKAASATDSTVPLGASAAQLYSLMCSQGFASKDFSAVYRLLSEQDGK